jgi:L-ascorbate metabolism protein UlaG (beta-lactamase superfamily)
MKIKFFGYNAFLIETGDKKIALDLGTLLFYWFRFTSLSPRSEWPDITHILITHGDPDHYWHADRVARVSNAAVICNETMDVEEAVRAVNIMRPRLVIPCHYNCPAFFTKTYNSADDQAFKREAEATGGKCVILGIGDSIELNGE